MDEISTASNAPESTGASVSDAAASASSSDASTAAVTNTTATATPETAPATVPEANATAATEPSIDAGWSLEDEPDSAALAPENDDDLNELTTEPGLDQTKVPGLVQAIKDARGAVKTYASEAKQLREQNAQLQQTLEQVGGDKGAKTWQQLLQAPQSEQGAVPFLTDLYDNAYPAYERLAKDAVLSNPTLALEVLQEAGLLPEIPDAPPATGLLSPDVMAKIPAHLHAIAKHLAVSEPEVLEDLLQRPDAVLKRDLERELKDIQRDQSDKNRDRNAAQRDYQSAKQSGQQAVIQLHEQYEQANFKILSKWQAHGPENAAANQRLHREVMEGAMSDLLSDKQYAQMYQDSQALLANAPLRRLNREGMQAEQDERQARQMAARVNTRLGQLIRERVQEREAVYSKARQWDEYQRSQTQSRTEIGGSSSQAANGKGVRTLDANGRVSSAYLEDLAQRFGGQRPG